MVKGRRVAQGAKASEDALHVASLKLVLGEVVHGRVDARLPVRARGLVEDAHHSHAVARQVFGRLGVVGAGRFFAVVVAVLGKVRHVHFLGRGGGEKKTPS